MKNFTFIHTHIIDSTTPLNEKRRTLMCTSLTDAKTGWALFHISNRKNWEFPNSRDFRHAMGMEFATFVHEFKELSISSGKQDRMGFCPGISHASAAHAITHKSDCQRGEMFKQLYQRWKIRTL
jgi:hypothetical protein